MSPSRAASRTLWVTKTIVVPVRCQIDSSSSCITSRVIASSAPKGSSINRMSASWASVRASATRCRIPPDSSCGRLSAKSDRCTSSSNSSTRSRRSVRLTLRNLSARSTLAATVSHGNSADSWNIRPVRPTTSSAPARRGVETGEQVEQRRLATPGGADDACEAVTRDRQRDRVERRHRGSPRSVHLRHGIQRDDRPLGSVQPAPPAWGRARRASSEHSHHQIPDTVGWPASVSTSFSRSSA